jgi:hypothetical protein
MPHHQRKLTSLHRKLIKQVRMIAVQRLPVRRWAEVIKLAWIRNDRSADGETTLLLNLQRREIALSARLCARASGEEQEYRE